MVRGVSRGNARCMSLAGEPWTRSLAGGQYSDRALLTFAKLTFPIGHGKRASKEAYRACVSHTEDLKYHKLTEIGK